MASPFRFLSTLILVCQVAVLYAQQPISISSPDKAVLLTIGNMSSGNVTYRISYKGKKVIEPSGLGFVFSKPQVTLDAFTIAKVDSSTIDGTWKPVWGEVSQIRNQYKELALTLTDKASSGISLRVRFRVFNDGVGFRYEFPQQTTLTHFVVDDEKTQFTLSADHKTFWVPSDYDTNGYLYTTTKLSEVDPLPAADKEKDIALKSIAGADVIQSPLLFKTDDGLYISIYVAALINYPVMHLRLDKKALRLTTQLVPDLAKGGGCAIRFVRQ